MLVIVRVTASSKLKSIFNDYSHNIDVNTAASYAYFLENKGTDTTEDGNKYQKLAGIDAKDGLVLFNLEAINSA